VLARQSLLVADRFSAGSVAALSQGDRDKYVPVDLTVTFRHAASRGETQTGASG